MWKTILAVVISILSFKIAQRNSRKKSVALQEAEKQSEKDFEAERDTANSVRKVSEVVLNEKLILYDKIDSSEKDSYRVKL
ncbi:hypothetical protein ThvES_00019630 [Thiovulum sp. ES]|nr:hypothetical protein ThvES_00019630 [Thiovulum sp. ES]